MSTETTYRATYAGKACRFYIRDGAAYGTVHLDRDPGFGSMILHSVPPCSVVLGEIVPPPTPAQLQAVRLREELRSARFVAVTTVNRIRAAAERVRAARLEGEIAALEAS